MSKSDAVPASCGVVAEGEPSTLRQDVERLRAIPAAWKQRPDPLGELEEIRNGPQGSPASSPKAFSRNTTFPALIDPRP